MESFIETNLFTMNNYCPLAYNKHKFKRRIITLHQQNQQQQNMQGSTQPPTNIGHGGHELLDAHETLEDLIGVMEQYILYDQHVQDEQLKNIIQRQKTFLTQMYNTIIDTLKTGKDPAVPTQTYEMQQSNEVTYGMQPSSPKVPAQTVQEINDECISSYMISILKQVSASFTTTAIEATNPVLRRVIADSLPNLIEMAYEIFLYQNKKQYYQVPQLAPQDMQALKNSFGPIQGGLSH